ncbi:unnamed protein product [Bursaphelenchus xylophilus]|uniref:(pine wood nematode) hypothetical protein n=1 Tax=Bursaphelenchus xylophilus TaxID=6326 RepID=A0A1I7S960_BURXY|nr:unnamed protein product [Bursaphelenchus xylophilus]CAD5210394.1 unnamed protein product [Bursaphelenchus xylophilus]CAG9086298.1 unnamed protein product [Bursaphelenchus xylophilus]CAG9086319.1 unnamed protein product [Bursaphelenchus xylophilus]
MFRPPSNIPYGGIHRKDGEKVAKGELLVAQRRLNYHPGRNVYCVYDRGQLLLKAECDGTVMITKERVDLDTENEFVERDYSHRSLDELDKLHFNVIQLPMSQKFKLVSEV